MHNMYTILQIKIEPYKYSLHSLHNNNEFVICSSFNYTSFSFIPMTIALTIGLMELISYSVH